MSDGSTVPAMHYADWLRRHAVTRGNSIAVQTPRGRLSYLDLHRALHVAANRLSESGIERGQIVALCILNQALLCVLIAALNRMGCVSVVLARPLQAGIEIHLPPGVAIDRVLIERPFQGEAPGNAMDVHADWLQTAGKKVRAWEGPGLSDGDSIAHIFTTTGTTDVRAVAFSTRQLEARIFRPSIGILSAGNTGKVMSQFALRSTTGFQTAFSTFWAGGTIFLGYPHRAMPALIARQGVERVEAWPHQFQEMLRESDPGQFDLASLRYAVIGGGTIPRPLIASIRSKICRVLIGHHGATEVGMISFGALQANDSPGRCGRLVPWMQAESVSPDGSPVPPGVEGDLRFRCEEMAREYLGDSAASARHFRDGWFYPGDIGTVGDDLVLTITGRSPERIDAGGETKVGPEPAASAKKVGRKKAPRVKK